MAQEIVLSGVGETSLRDSLSLLLLSERPRVIGIASAFVSTEGVRQLTDILRRCGEPECRLIAGTDGAITHPEALFAARDNGWTVRLGKSRTGIFHPKLVVAGSKFGRGDRILDMCGIYVGSSNLTAGGLGTNVECGLIADAEGCLVSASNVFAHLWRQAQPATDMELRNYAARFAECSRRRSVSELVALGVNDTLTHPTEPVDLRTRQLPARPALGATFAVAAWAGLQSFTGQYRFQLEFPRDAGQVISQLLNARVEEDGRLDVYCVDDETTRSMQYKFYPQNSMFRLNMPNDVPGVDWARNHKDGLALVEKGPAGGALLRIRLLKPGAEANEVVTRSVMLGTWGRTPTRSYGWF